MEYEDTAGLSRRRLMWLAAVALAGCHTVPAPVARPEPPAAPLPAEPPAPPPVVAAPPPPPPRPPRIGLALGGGAARGFAHIGVIQVLEEHGIRPDLVVGTSAGSLVATLYASGRDGRALEALAASMDETALTDWSFPGRGLIRGEGLARYVRTQTGGRLIEALPVPLGIVATDLDNGQPVLFRRGDPGAAVRASSAVPAVFQPVKIQQREYVDGGLTSPIPVRFARQMGAELVIAVDISAVPDGNSTADALRMLLQTFAIMGRTLGQYELKEADVVVRPRLPGVAGTDFGARAKAISAGRTAMLLAMGALKDAQARLTH